MVEQTKKPNVIAVVGPTASGKTSLSIAIAKHCNGEIISADSRQVYTGMDIGSGKVTKSEMDKVPHHLLDIADPMEIYTGSRFVVDADQAMTQIIKRQHVPIVAGGTFFYVDLLRRKMATAPVAPNPDYRATLADLSTAQLYEQLQQADPRRAATIDPYNRRRLERAMEIINTLGTVPPATPPASDYNWLVLAIDIEKDQLHDNISKRLSQRLNEGMIAEVERLHYEGVTYERLESFGLEYRYIAKHLQGELSYEEMVAQLQIKIQQFAKQQITWLQKDTTLQWVQPDDLSTILSQVDNFLTNK